MNHLEHHLWSPNPSCGWLEIRTAKSLLYPIYIYPIIYLILFVPLKPVELYCIKRSKNLLEFWGFWSVFASGVDFPPSLPSVDVLMEEGRA